jgi:hypothetical protein
MGPRYLDPMTADEQGLAGESRPGIDYFANTSTMEYQIERGGESVGLGTYDQHAMKVLYGRVIETLDEHSSRSTSSQTSASRTTRSCRSAISSSTGTSSSRTTRRPRDS